MSMMANGTIIRCRFVALDPTANHKVIQAVLNGKIFGISGDEARTPPTPDVGIAPYEVARVGEQLNVHPSSCETTLEIGAGGCKAGDSLTADASGAGIKNPGSGHPPHVGAVALTAANPGELARVWVTIYDMPPAAGT
jgi:hypothetical protein